MNTKITVRNTLLLFIFTLMGNTTFAQKTTNVSKAKITIPITELKAKLLIDTTGVIFPNRKNDDFVLVYSKETDDGYGFRMSFNKDDILTIDDYKKDYKAETITEIDNRNYLESHTDSSSFKLNNLKYWYETECIREVPAFWAQMKNKDKLSSKDMTTYLTSDKKSQENGENYLLFYTTTPSGKEVIRITVLFFYEDTPHQHEIEQKAKEILAGFSFVTAVKKS